MELSNVVGVTTQRVYPVVPPPVIAVRFTVLFASSLQEFDGGVMGQRFDATGIPIGASFPVNLPASGSQNSPAVAALADGDFISVWMSQGAGNIYQVESQRFGLGLASVTGDVMVVARPR